MCRCWALALFGGNSERGFDQNTTYSIFSIFITLTDEGYQNFYQVRKLRAALYAFGNSRTHCLTVMIIIGGAFGVPVHEDASETQTPAEVSLRALVSSKLHIQCLADAVIHFLTKVFRRLYQKISSCYFSGSGTKNIIKLKSCEGEVITS